MIIGQISLSADEISLLEKLVQIEKSKLQHLELCLFLNHVRSARPTLLPWRRGGCLPWVSG